MGDRDFCADLLFYHLKLRCVEQNAGSSDPSYVGQMNVYLSAVDDLLRRPDDKPTIGMLLCRGKDRLVVEYALRDVHKPIGAADSETRLVHTLPEELKGESADGGTAGSRADAE